MNCYYINVIFFDYVLMQNKLQLLFVWKIYDKLSINYSKGYFNSQTKKYFFFKCVNRIIKGNHLIYCLITLIIYLVKSCSAELRSHVIVLHRQENHSSYFWALQPFNLQQSLFVNDEPIVLFFGFRYIRIYLSIKFR